MSSGVGSLLFGLEMVNVGVERVEDGVRVRGEYVRYVIIYSSVVISVNLLESVSYEFWCVFEVKIYVYGRENIRRDYIIFNERCKSCVVRLS